MFNDNLIKALHIEIKKKSLSHKEGQYREMSVHFGELEFVWNGIFFPLVAVLIWMVVALVLLGSLRLPDGYEANIYQFLNLLSNDWVLQVTAGKG